MRRYATFFIIACMSLGLIFLLVTRERTKHEAPAEILEPKDADGGDAGALDAGALDAGDGAAAAPAKPAEKPLRITALGWDLLAAGAVLSPLDGGAPAAPVPAFELAPELALDAVEARLARGGADPQGADIAVLPLPAFVASYERLRALDPRAFLVVGFSHGREEVHAAGGALLKAPPAGDEVKLVGLGPATASEAAARAAGSESATLLGLFALDLIGAPAAKVRIVAPGSDAAKAAPFAALTRGAADDRKVAFSSADASRLVPIVAVAPKSVLDAREGAVREWARAWLDGLARTGADVPGIARRLAAKEALPLAAGVAGAPEALALVERLGQIQNVALDQESSVVGAQARGVTLDMLLARTWQLSRGGGLTASAAPEPLPIDARIVTAIAPPPKPEPAPASAEGDAGLTFGPIAAGAVPVVLYRSPDADAEKAATQIMFLASVFERASFRITVKGGEKNARAVATLAHDKGLALGRLATAAAEPAGVPLTVEILSPP